MKLVPVDPASINNVREGRRGRVSYPILKMFLESNEDLVMVDRTGMQNSFQGLYSSLRAYISSHSLPVEIFSRQGEIYLARIREDPNAKGTEGHELTEADLPPMPITPDEVQSRAAVERGQITK